MSSENLDDTKPLADISRPRFGQLTYTSFDRPALGRGQVLGGWQVKDVIGELDGAEQDSVRAGINTRLETVVAPPAFPTQEQIESRPRRLHYGPLNGAAVAYWHSVQAGSDASGRPGNVFVHVLVDRNPDLPPLRRPISLWHSEGWLAPFGAARVSTSELVATEVFPPSGAMELSTIMNFVLDPEIWRIGVLCVLLDAVKRAVDTGGTVVLGVEGPDRGALWIGAVSSLMSASSASRFYFSTYERRPSIEDLEALNVHLVCVPVEDLTELELPATVVVLSELETPELGQLDVDPHRTTRGVVVPVTEWSVLAQTVLVDPDTAATALGKLDAIADADPVRGAETAWPLAKLVLGDKGFSDAHTEAGTVINHVPPLAAQFQSVPAASAASVSIAKPAPGRAITLDSGSQSMRGPVQEIFGYSDRSGLAPEQAEVQWSTFLEYVVANPGWSRTHHGELYVFGQRDNRPSLELVALARSVTTDFFNRLGVMNRPAGYASSLLVEIEIVRFADLIMFARLSDEETVRSVQDLVEWAVLPLLLDDSMGPVFVHWAGAIRSPLRELLRGCIADGKFRGYFEARPLGTRVSAAVVEWLLPHADLPIEGEIPSRTEIVEEPAVALVSDMVLRQLADPAVSELGQWGPFVPMALWRLLWESQAGNGEPAGAARFGVSDATVLLRSQHLLPADLKRMAREYPGVIPPRFLTQFVISHIDDPDSSAATRSFADSLLRSATDSSCVVRCITPPDPRRDETALSWAYVRAMDRWDERGPVELMRLVGLMRPAMIDFCGMSRTEIAELSCEVLDRMTVLVVASRWTRDRDVTQFVPYFGAEHIEALRVSALGGRADYVSDSITELVKSQIFEREWLVTVVMLLTDGAPETARNPVDLLTSIGLGIGDGSRLLETLAKRSLSNLSESDERGPALIDDMLMRELTRRAAQTGPANYKKYGPYAREWFDYLVTAKAKQAPLQGFIARTFGKDKG